MISQLKDNPYIPYNYLNRFLGSQSADDTADIIGRINREEGDQATFARGGIPGIVAGFASSLLSPFTLIPLGGEIEAVASARTDVTVKLPSQRRPISHLKKASTVRAPS